MSGVEDRTKHNWAVILRSKNPKGPGFNSVSIHGFESHSAAKAKANEMCKFIGISRVGGDNFKDSTEDPKVGKRAAVGSMILINGEAGFRLNYRQAGYLLSYTDEMVATADFMPTTSHVNACAMDAVSMTNENFFELLDKKTASLPRSGGLARSMDVRFREEIVRLATEMDAGRTTERLSENSCQTEKAEDMEAARAFPVRIQPQKKAGKM